MYNLDDLYLGFDDPKFKEDIQKVETLLQQIDHLDLQATKETLKDTISKMEALRYLSRSLMAFCSLSTSSDTSNKEASRYQYQLSQLFSNYAKSLTRIEKYFGSLDSLDDLLKGDEVLQEYRFFFEEAHQDFSYLLSDEVEEVVSKMSLSGGNGWSTQYRYLTSRAQTTFNGEITSLNELRNMAYSPDADTRKAAYEAELKLTESLADPIAFSLNNIKSEVLTTLELRGYESIMDLTLQQNRMTQETLDALLEAIQAYLPAFRKYLKHKAKLLGHEGSLPWYDMFAPLQSNLPEKRYSIEDAKAYLINLFSQFSEDLAQLTRDHFEKDWIDFLPRKGKVGGAFCLNLPHLKQSRILTNYDYSFSDIVTLAHELGHSYHGFHIQDHRPLNQGYTMPVAETASTFNEVLLMHFALKEVSDEEKKVLLESSLSDLNQIITDIYSRYLFEKSVYEQRPHKFMFADELAEMMTTAQTEAYGDGLDENYLHPYMWVVKGHYYRPNLSFYNFPYAFGGLFARGLFAQYLDKPEGFVEKYQALLKATTVHSVEDTAAKMDIDVRDKNFWVKALEQATQQIDLWIELTSK